jgi:hypothetical protein
MGIRIDTLIDRGIRKVVIQEGQDAPAGKLTTGFAEEFGLKSQADRSR